MIFKSYLSLIMLSLIFVAMFTMFEIFGRVDKKYNIEKLKKIHKANGIVFLLLYFVTAYFCLQFLLNTKAELSARAALHGVFSLAVILLLFLKFSFVRIYKQFFSKVQTIGILIALISFLMIGTSAGYYLLITRFGTDMNIGKTTAQGKEAAQKGNLIAARTDKESIAKGKELYESKCYFCHDAYSYDQGVGPGHKRIMKNPLLPVSRKPASPENIADQIRRPYKDMPAFSYLSEDEVQDVIAFLNTL